VGPPAIYRCIEAGKVHFKETPAGLLIVGRKSLAIDC
jgi:hypothetical protein